MTGERALIAVISIFWITAALIVMPAVFLLGTAIATGEDIPDLWQQIIRQILQSLWFAVPAVFLARGSWSLVGLQSFRRCSVSQEPSFSRSS